MAEDVGAELRAGLVNRAEVDQQARRALTPLFDRQGTVQLCDLNDEERALVDRLTEVDHENTRWLREVVERRGLARPIARR